MSPGDIFKVLFPSFCKVLQSDNGKVAFVRNESKQTTFGLHGQLFQNDASFNTGEFRQDFGSFKKGGRVFKILGIVSLLGPVRRRAERYLKLPQCR